MLARLIRIPSLLALLAVLLALRVQAHAADQDETESDTDEEPAEGSADAADPNQPSVYSGGRYTIVNFPISELDRTLTLVQGVLELRADLGIDMTKGSTFKTWAILLQGHFGITDTLEAQAAFNSDLVVPDGVDRTIGVAAAVEGAIMYDLIDWRVGAEVSIAPGDATVSFFAGLPVKFRVLKDKLAILAFDKVLTIHTNSVPDSGSTTGGTTLRKPDLTLSIGFLVQILKPLALIVRAEVDSIGFEGDIQVPLTIEGQYTISSVADVGIELLLLDLNRRQAEGASTDLKRVPIDNRAIAFFFRFRM